MRVFVFGHTGMLGRYVYTYLKSKGVAVEGVDRRLINAALVNFADLDMLCSDGCDVFINCMGVIPQRGKTDNHTTICVNSAFPHLLQSYCSSHNMKLIHVTTDCVFDGLGGNYTEDHAHTALDMYGKTKSLGEPASATVIRTSIIGEEIINKKSLLEWVKFNENCTVDGYLDHYWNGITCLQFAKICEEILLEEKYWKGTKHINSPGKYTKYDLVSAISINYDLNVTINPVETGRKCDRSLLSVVDDVTFKVPDLNQQIKEQKDFFTTLKGE